jgi:hypothetical protein
VRSRSIADGIRLTGTLNQADYLIGTNGDEVFAAGGNVDAVSA